MRRLRPGLQAVSLGGATEASIWSILHPIGDVSPEQKSIPYGRPMLNQRFHVLDAALEPCPVWVPGQLYIGGEGLAKGYWKDEERTAASFFVHPGTGERLYRTGDLGRYLPDGEIEFLGRADFQVKVQGHRIELEEIESVLLQHPGVRAAVVTAVGDRPGRKRLVGYFTPASAPGPQPEALSDFLRQKLPGYMVPASLVALESLPLTANGKVDRKALTQRGEQQPQAAEDEVAPRDPLEQELVELYAALLEVERVSIYDNFFELGGNSLLATRLASRLREAFHVEVPLRTLFKSSTVAGLALELVQLQLEQEKPEAAARLLGRWSGCRRPRCSGSCARWPLSGPPAFPGRDTDRSRVPGAHRPSPASRCTG
jgi:hypothetical protein